jgi:hypothetical protein
MTLTLDDVKRHMLNAAHAAFLPLDDRKLLIAQFEAGLGIVTS